MISRISMAPSTGRCETATENSVQGSLPHSGSPSLLTPNGELFKTVREGATGASWGPQQQSQFRYDIPVPPGTYELRLYFADPARTMESTAAEGSQNLRHFSINLNGRPLLTGFDAIADAGPAAVDIRVFKDVSPAPDGLVHLEFLPDPAPPFLSALELKPGIPGKMKPIRIAARKAEFVDADGVNWSSDQYYVDGRVLFRSWGDLPQGVPELRRLRRSGCLSIVPCEMQRLCAPEGLRYLTGGRRRLSTHCSHVSRAKA